MSALGQLVRILIRVGGLWCLPAALSAQTVIYAIDTSNTLYSVDPGTQTATPIGQFNTNYIEGLAVSPGGLLYGTDDTGLLYSINTATGATTPIISTGLGDIEGLAFSGNTLVCLTFDRTPTLFSINPTTRAVAQLAVVSTLSGVPRAMTVYSDGRALVTADGGDSTTNNLYALDLATGQATLIGSMPITGQFAALTYTRDGILYGFGNSGQVWRINPDTAAITLVGSTGSQFWLDATTLAVPEPSTWLLLLTGIGSIFLTVVRRRARV